MTSFGGLVWVIMCCIQHEQEMCRKGLMVWEGGLAREDHRGWCPKGSLLAESRHLPKFYDSEPGSWSCSSWSNRCSKVHMGACVLFRGTPIGLRIFLSWLRNEPRGDPCAKCQHSPSGLVSASPCGNKTRSASLPTALKGCLQKPKCYLQFSTQQPMFYELCTIVVGKSHLPTQQFAAWQLRRPEGARSARSARPPPRTVRILGSAAINFAWLACGRLDGWFEATFCLGYLWGGSPPEIEPPPLKDRKGPVKDP